jgi:hypothetical protein
MLGSTDVTNRLFLFIIHVLCLFFVVVLMNQSCGRFGAVQGGRREGGGHKMYAKLDKVAPRKQKAVVLILQVDLNR